MFTSLMIFCTHRKVVPVISLLAIFFGMMLVMAMTRDEVKSEKRLKAQQVVDPCKLQLEEAKTKLEELITSKDQADQILSDTFRHRDNEKEHVKDVVQSCLTMTQQSVACEDQLETLRYKCRESRARCGKEPEDKLVQQILNNRT